MIFSGNLSALWIALPSQQCQQKHGAVWSAIGQETSYLNQNREGETVTVGNCSKKMQGSRPCKINASDPYPHLAAAYSRARIASSQDFDRVGEAIFVPLPRL